MAGEKKVAVVTGSSSGIGLETSLELSRNGFHTYATVRNLEEKFSNITEKVVRQQYLSLLLFSTICPWTVAIVF